MVIHAPIHGSPLLPLGFGEAVHALVETTALVQQSESGK